MFYLRWFFLSNIFIFSSFSLQTVDDPKKHGPFHVLEQIDSGVKIPLPLDKRTSDISNLYPMVVKLTASHEAPSPSDNPDLSVWKIASFEEKREEYIVHATGFFIGRNHFITNFHVISSMLREATDSTKIVLSQQGKKSILKVKGVLAVSALHDLALLEIEGNVTPYLSLRENPPEPSEDLFLISYPNGKFTKMKKTENIIYEDKQRYDFPVNHSYLYGTSGSPVLDKKGKVVGIVFIANGNILSTRKTHYLREFIAENIGIKCVQTVSAVYESFKGCIEKEIENLKEQAEQGFVYAQFILARYYGRTAKQNLEKALEWYEKAAEQGYAPAQEILAYMYQEGEGVEQNFEEAFQPLKISAEQGYTPAQEALVLCHKSFERVFKLLTSFF